MDNYTHEQLDLSIHMGHLVKEQVMTEQKIRDQVDLMRDAEMSWAKIGVALGTSAQSAWERYSGHQRDSEITIRTEILPGL